MALAQTLSGKRILLVIGGGIAAYKCLDLIRRLLDRCAQPGVLAAGGRIYLEIGIHQAPAVIAELDKSLA